MTTDIRTNELKLNDDRFDSFMYAASQGDEIAIHSLWMEYEYDYHTAAFQDDYYEDLERWLDQPKAYARQAGVDPVDLVDFVEVGGTR